jgi:hypothetical protein
MPATVKPESLAPTSVAIPLEPVAAETQDRQEPTDARRRYLWFHAAPAWLVSMLVHVLVLLVLGLVTIADPVKIVNVLSANPNTEEGPEVEEFTIEEMDPGEVSEIEETVEPVDVTESMEIVEPTELEPMEIASVTLDTSDLASEMAPSAVSLQTLSSMNYQPLGSRSADMKKKLLRDYGGTESSEAAVTEALKWLSRHQMPNGAWTFQHNLVCNGRCGNPGEPNRARAFNAATAMGLLPFLGAGQTHLNGEFKEVVFRGLRFLIQNGKAGKQGGLPVLDLSEGGGNMYSHGLAAIALCEAYAMTEDPELAGPAQGALNFIIYAQCRDGGWRYQPQQPDGGDTSVTGWQVMALKSGYMGHLMVPPKTIQGSMLFLDKVQSNYGALYGYTGPSTSIRPSCTAIGLLCRMYTGWDKGHPGIVQGVDELSKVGVLKNDIYYDYYAAQVLRHYGGERWDRFNIELRDWLVSTQSQTEGEKGSWHFPNHVSHRGPKEGGRLASTAFATMILEVYYRHMPLYADAAADDDFPL